jgi:propanol-preferring alcohol dehydrogenase
MSSSFQIPKTQKAAVLHELQGNYRIEKEWPVTQPHELKPGQCLVKMEYTGVCYSDLIIKNRVVAPPDCPFVGGHEGVGVVVAIGEHTQDLVVKIGDRVGLKYIAKVCEMYVSSSSFLMVSTTWS